MTTQAVMIAEIQSDTGRTATSYATPIRAKIAAAIRRWEQARFWFNETDAITFPTVSSTNTYTFATIGTVFYTIDAVFITVNSEEYELKRVNWVDERADAGGSTNTGTPVEYAYGNRGLKFYPTPDQVYTVRLMGHYLLAGPTDDVTDNDWMTHAYDLIMCRTKAELYAHRWEDPTNAQLMVVAEQDALNALRGSTFDKTSTGYLAAMDF